MDVYTSMEATGYSAEYIRDGLDFEQWWYNLVKLHFNDIDTLRMMTINALCLPTLPDMIEKILRARDLFDNNFATMSFNILRFPSS